MVDETVKINLKRQQMTGMVIDKVAQFDEMDAERLQKESVNVGNTCKIRTMIQVI